MKGLLFTYGLAYGGAVVSLFNPFVGLMIYISFAIIKPESMWYWSVPQGNYSRLIALALLAGWAINGFGYWNFRRAKPIVLMLLRLWIWIAVSALFASDQTRAWNHFEALSKIFLPTLVGMTLIDSVSKLRITAWIVMLSQGYVALELNRAYYSGFNRVTEIGFGGMDNNCNAVAAVTGAGLAFFLGLGESVLWRKMVAFVSAALMAHMTMFAFSRGGMLALVIVGVVTFLLIPKKPAHYLLFALAVALAIRLAGPQVMARFSSTFVDAEERDTSAQSRVDLWKDCWDVMLTYPITGAGPNHWPLMAPKYGWPTHKSAHSLWMQMGAELGFPGLGLIAAFYVCTIWLLLKLLANPPEDEPWLADAARMVIASLCGFAVAAQFVSLEGLELPYYVVLLGAGTLRNASADFTVSDASQDLDVDK